MALRTIMFYSGSILHEKAADGSERVLRDHYSTALMQTLEGPDEEPVRPVLGVKPGHIKTQEEWERMHLLKVKQYEAQHVKWVEASFARENYVKLSEEATTKDKLVLVAYNELLTLYDIHQYLRCVHEHLAEFLAPITESCGYLLHAGRNVLSHGKKNFYLFKPAVRKHIRQKDPDNVVEEKMGAFELVGSFARTASVTDYKTYQGEPLNMPAKVRFIKTKTEPAEYDAIGPTAPVPETHDTVPVNGEETTANKSSVVILDDMNAFIDKMIARDVGFPVFSVSDCNSFHTSGYLWALYGLRKARLVYDDGDAAAPALFLNFDQHTDAGSAGNMVASDRWGAPALSQLTNGMYMSFGCSGKTADSTHGLNKEYQWTNVFMYRNSADGGGTKSVERAAARKISTDEGSGRSYLTLTPKQQFEYVSGILTSLKGRWSAVVGEPKKAALTGLQQHGNGLTMVQPIANFPPDLANLDLREIFLYFWQSFVAYLGRPIKYVYVTVDRDSIQGHQTQWGENSLFPNAHSLYQTITAVVDPVFDVCPGARLIGFDITGLPESRAVYGVQTRRIHDVESTWEEMVDELTLMHAWARQRIAPVPGFVNKAWTIFSSLSFFVNNGLLKGILSTITQDAITTFTFRLQQFMAEGGASTTTKGVFASRHRAMLETIRDALATASTAEKSGPYYRRVLKRHADDLSSLLEYIAG